MPVSSFGYVNRLKKNYALFVIFYVTLTVNRNGLPACRQAGLTVTVSDNHILSAAVPFFIHASSIAGPGFMKNSAQLNTLKRFAAAGFVQAYAIFVYVAAICSIGLLLKVFTRVTINNAAARTAAKAGSFPLGALTFLQCYITKRIVVMLYCR